MCEKVWWQRLVNQTGNAEVNSASSRVITVCERRGETAHIEREDAFWLQESSSTERYNVCGTIRGKIWDLAPCHRGLWDEADHGHVVWTSSVQAIVVPSGSLLSTSRGEVRILSFPSSAASAPTLVNTVPFESSMWSLTSGIPATTRALDFSFTSRTLVRKTPRVSQMGTTTTTTTSTTTPQRLEVFMTNNPSSPTHWLSQIRLDMQGGAAHASTYQSLEVTKTYELRQKCNYQTCNGCVDLDVQRLCYGAQQCTIARCIGTLTNQNRCDGHVSTE